MSVKARLAAVFDVSLIILYLELALSKPLAQAAFSSSRLSVSTTQHLAGFSESFQSGRNSRDANHLPTLLMLRSKSSVS